MMRATHPPPFSFESQYIIYCTIFKVLRLYLFQDFAKVFGDRFTGGIPTNLLTDFVAGGNLG